MKKISGIIFACFLLYNVYGQDTLEVKGRVILIDSANYDFPQGYGKNSYHLLILNLENDSCWEYFVARMNDLSKIEKLGYYNFRILRSVKPPKSEMELKLQKIKPIGEVWILKESGLYKYIIIEATKTDR